ncbi:hypothetical protein GGR52DRAFT_497302 [Hypoxylon sp. FL1284]|nr:hypothetical protein GGR52DRAFT_497302 [Hypoxylon sp. FL1284]
MRELLVRLGQCGRLAIAPKETDRNKKPQHTTSLDHLLKGRVYINELPPDVEAIRWLLEKYSGIRARDVDDHIYHIRERLWDIYPHVFVGHFRFLSLKLTADPLYRIALDRLTNTSSPANFLDVGCCVGQVLRQLASDGVDPSRLYGADLESQFMDAGFDLFKDRDRTGITFVPGDVVNDDGGDERLGALDGKMSLVHASSFFHLFTRDDQVRAATRIVRFLDPRDPDVAIFGRHVGTTRPDDRGIGGSRGYLHDAGSWQALWDDVGMLTGTSWRVEVEDVAEPGSDLQGVADGTLRQVRFGIFRA